jgi:hypothetical protein
MSSWEKWKARTIWLVSFPQLIWNKALVIAKQRPVLATIAGVLAVVLCGGLYYEKRALLDFFNHADKDGKIVINSPTVYTRQRLVNDRLDQAHWLRSQLELTDNGPSDKLQFQSIDQIRRVMADSQLNLGTAPGATTAEKAATELAVETTTLALFRAKNTYREEVRSEITQTELDDRHDIRGNTIFRLTFDASVIAGTRHDAVAAIVVRLSHHPDDAISAKKQPYYDDYRILYDDWMRYFQETILVSLANIQGSFSSRDPHPRLRTVFTEFLTRRICQFAQNDADLTKDPLPCSPAQLKMVTKLISDHAESRLKKLEEYKNKVFDATLGAYDAAGYVFPAFTDTKNKTEGLRYNARASCARDNRTEIALWELGVRLPNSPQIKISEQLAVDRISCPYYDNLQARMVSGVQLYEDILSILGQNRPAFVAGNLTDDAKQIIQTLDACERDGCEVRSSRLRCFSADFIKANLNAFIDRYAEAKQRIDHFLKFEVVGRELNDCNILVTGLPDSITGKDGKTYSLLQEFAGSLNRGTDAFAYSVTPKNLTENISTASDTRDALLFRATGKDKDIANLLRSRSEQNRQIVAHPIIVGYGSPGIVLGEKQEFTGIRDIDFGWVIAPRTREGGVFEQIDGQYPLTVVASVPGWWRTVEMRVKTCWISRTTNFAAGQSIKNMCPGHEDEPGAIAIRLPSSSSEISRKLGFDDVVQQPSLNPPRSQQELVVGKRGSLLLEGQRLWRSTEVTIGSQRADRITVLPNMGGILAEFKCVQPPSGLRVARRNLNVTQDDNQIVTKDWIRVWTSEGVTEALPIDLLWLTESEDLLAKCQPSTQAAAQGAPQKSTPETSKPPAGTKTTTAPGAATPQSSEKPTPETKTTPPPGAATPQP